MYNTKRFIIMAFCEILSNFKTWILEKKNLHMKVLNVMYVKDIIKILILNYIFK